MRLVRLRHQGADRWGALEDDHVEVIDGPDPSDRVRTGNVVPINQAHLLAPAAPLNVIGMAHNTGPDDAALPPQAFLKPARTVSPPGAAIEVPTAGRVDAEAELAVVIGRTARRLTTVTALSHVLGYTLTNDVTSRDQQASDPLWTSAKGGDGWTPLGPWLETELDPGDVEITLSINGRDLQPGSTRDLARGVAEVLAYITSFMTLGPGDIVLTGAPGEYGQITPGDEVTASSPALGALTNTVAAEPTARTGEAS